MYYLKTLLLKLTELQLLLLQVAAQCFFEGLSRGKVLKEKHPSCCLLGGRPQGFPSLQFPFLFDSELGSWQSGVSILSCSWCSWV